VQNLSQPAGCSSTHKAKAAYYNLRTWRCKRAAWHFNKPRADKMYFASQREPAALKFSDKAKCPFSHTQGHQHGCPQSQQHREKRGLDQVWPCFTFMLKTVTQTSTVMADTLTTKQQRQSSCNVLFLFYRLQCYHKLFCGSSHFNTHKSEIDLLRRFISW